MPLSTVTVPAFLGLATFLRLYLHCSPYNSILLVHDARTYDLATTVLSVASSAPLSNWITLDMGRLHTPAILDRSALPLLNDTETLYVWLLPASSGGVTASHHRLSDEFRSLRSRLTVNEHCDNLVIVQGLASTMQITRLLHYARCEQIVNVALVQTPAAQNSAAPVSVLKLHYEFFTATAYAVDESRKQICATTLFYDKTTEWKDREILIFMIFEPPFVINLTRTVYGEDGQPKVQFNVGGSYAYLASLIDEHFGTHSQNFAVEKQNQYENAQMARFQAEFMERPYREDGRRPRWLRYDLLYADDWDNYTFGRTVISFEEQIFVPPGTYSLYPHSLEQYILCVPNQPHERSTLWSSLLCFPLFYVWSFVIATITLLRTVLRKLQGLGGQSVADMLFHTCGMSFGAVTTVHVENRPERVLLLFMSLFTMISGILCAGLLFQKFTTKVSEPGITSLQQLGERAYLDVCMPEEFAVETEQWLRKQIPNRIVRMDKFLIQSMIYSKNTSSAYIVSKMKSSILLQRKEMLDARGNNLFHELNYPIVSQQIRFVVPSWYMIRRLSALLHQTIEHGFLQYYEMRTAGILKFWQPGQMQTMQQQTSQFNKDALVMLPMDELWFVFVIYAMGLFAGCVAFFGEHIYAFLNQRKERRRF